MKDLESTLEEISVLSKKIVRKDEEAHHFTHSYRDDFSYEEYTDWTRDIILTRTDQVVLLTKIVIKQTQLIQQLQEKLL